MAVINLIDHSEEYSQAPKKRFNVCMGAVDSLKSWNQLHPMLRICMYQSRKENKYVLPILIKKQQTNINVRSFIFTLF
jgi:hypothetical protein